MHQEVKEYVKACSVCQQQKMERVKPAGMLGSSPRVTQPFEVLCSDLVGPLPRSSKQNTMMLVCVDFFSKFTFLKPLREATQVRDCNPSPNY